MRIAVTVLAALTLAGGSASAAQADDGNGEGLQRNTHIVVEGDHNQVVVGDENVVGRGEVDSSGHGDGESDGNGDGLGTPSKPYGTVTDKIGVIVRAEASQLSNSVGSLQYNAQVGLKCYTHGQQVGSTDVWYKLRDRVAYVTAAYVKPTGNVPPC